MKKIILLFTIITGTSFAHEGHGNPGAIPPAPNGGAIIEAKHMHHGSHKHDHKEASKKEIFFEGVYKKGTLKIFPLELDPKGHKNFILLNVEDFKHIKLEVEDARKKLKLKGTFETVGKSWNYKVSNDRARRFIIHISGIYMGAKYHAKVQVEKK